MRPDRTAGLRVAGLGCAAPDGRGAVFEGVRLSLGAGEVGVISGRTGSGKTTLLRAIAGCAPAGARVDGEVSAGRCALLLQDVESQLLCSTVFEEVASGLRARGLTGTERSARVGRALARVGLLGFEARCVDELSAGERQRVVIAALVALEPDVLLLDEPTSALDPEAREGLVDCIGALAAAGTTVLIAEHLLHPFARLAPKRWHLEKGSCVALPGTGARTADEPLAAANGPRLALDATGPPALRCRDLSVHDATGRTLLANVSFAVARGGRLLVTGPNGSGKTTLLRTVAGLLRPSRGEVTLAEPSGAGRRRAGARVGLLFQHPERNLFEGSVADEVAFGLARAGLRGRALDERLGALLVRCGLSGLDARSPLRISYGEQHRVALASVLAPAPPVLLLDEPFSGLDPVSRGALLDLLWQEQRRTAAAIVIASHDPAPFAPFVDETLDLGRRREASGR